MPAELQHPGVPLARVRIDTWVNAITGPATQVVDVEKWGTGPDGESTRYTVKQDALETLTEELFDRTSWAAIVVATDEGSTK